MKFLESIKNIIQQTSLLEWLLVVPGIWYVSLINIYKNSACFFCTHYLNLSITGNITFIEDKINES